MRGADLVTRTLAEAGVRTIFSLSGNQIMPVYDACIDARLKIIHVRHEAATVFMADAWAQLTGGIGVALTTAGPGFANALGALSTARAAESPVLFLSGDAPIGQDGRGAFQAMDQTAMSAPLTKASIRATSAASIGEDVARAISIARSGRPGPVHLAMPFDVLEAQAPGAAMPAKSDFAPQTLAHDAAEIDALAAALAGASRPLVIFGPSLNATRGRGLAGRLADAVDAPVLALESPRGLKDPSLGAVAQAFAKADLVVSLGKPIDFSLGFGGEKTFDPSCRWIVVNADEKELERARLNLGARLDAAFAADAAATAERLITTEKRPAAARAQWRDDVASSTTRRSFDMASAKSAPRISPLVLCQAVQRQFDAAAAAGRDSVLVCDGGEFGQWAMACLSARERVVNGPSGAIGGSLCYGIAAQLARPDALVIAMMGDGTSGFHFGEFETAARCKAPFICVIGNDACWNAEHQIQLREYGKDRLIGCELTPARYDLAAIGLGCHGEYVTKASELDAALARAIASGLPACINVDLAGEPAPSGPAAH